MRFPFEIKYKIKLDGDINKFTTLEILDFVRKDFEKSGADSVKLVGDTVFAENRLLEIRIRPGLNWNRWNGIGYAKFQLLESDNSSNYIGFRIVRSEFNLTPKKSSQTQVKKQFAIIIKIAPEIVGKGNGILEITKNGKEKSIDNIPVNGRYTLNLDYFNEYSLTFKYPEHIDKTILVSTEIPKEIWENNSNFSTFPMVVNLMKKTDENVKSDEGKPILKIAYIKELDNFGKVTK